MNARWNFIRTTLHWLSALLLVGAIIVLALNAGDFLIRAAHAIASPFGIDYGEGIVWQQALLMRPGTMYGAIDHLPYVVFHYPPLYHLSVRLLSAVTGADMLASGRSISVLSTLVIAVLTARLAWRNAGADASRTGRVVAALVAGLSLFAWWPVMFWAVLMRVDMLAGMFTIIGVSLGIAALTRPRLLYLAMLSFVAASLCKQTELVAPVVVLAIHGWRCPWRATRAAALGALLGLAAAASLQILSDGGFLRHILSYNLNRMTLGNMHYALLGQVRQWPMVALSVAGLLLICRREGLAGLGARLRSDPHLAELAIICLLPLLLLPGLVSTAKSGGWVNYFIPIMTAGTPLIGILAGHCVMRVGSAGPGWAPSLAALCVPALLALQPGLAGMPPARFDTPEFVAAQTAMLERFRAVPGMILADNMVLLLRAGKQVTLEPSIFAELAAMGRWDSAKLVDLVEQQAFAMIQTEHGLDSVTTRARYDPAVLAAIRHAYPRAERVADGLLLLPGQPGQGDTRFEEARAEP